MMRITLSFSIVLWITSAMAQVPAFPGAEGAGANAYGWRNGSVYFVTNLNTSGPGSFFEGVSKPNRIIIFKVSGTIDLTNGTKGGNYKLGQPNILIAGQSAPGEGICFKGGGIRILRSNVVLRYLRFRRGYVVDGDTGDGVAADPDSATYNIIFDHLSASWGTDENLTLTKPYNTTAQYCIASEGLDYTNSFQTPPNHSEGSLWGTMKPNGNVSMHHMLYAHNRLRNPRTTAFANTDEAIAPVNDFRNSIVYNCSEYTSHTGSEMVKLNWINNYYKDGPSTSPAISQIIFTMMNNPKNKLFLSENYVFGSTAKTGDNWLAVNYEDGLTESNVQANTAYTTAAVTTQPASEAYETVLEDGGAILPSRDQVDLRIVNDVKNGTGKVINKEIDLAAVDRWQTYVQLASPVDTDNDGMPDFWEDQFGLDKNNATDNMTDVDADVYVNVEEYLNNTDPKGGSKPIVFVAAYDNRASETGDNTGRFRIFRSSADLSEDLVVKYSWSGTAAKSLDYHVSEETCTIPAGKKSAYITISALVDNNLNENDETIILSIIPDSSYHTGLPAQSVVVVSDSQISSVAIQDEMDFKAEVFPNPAKNSINIRMKNTDGPVKFSIMDVMGREVKTQNLAPISGNQALSIDISHLSSGIYHYLIQTNTWSQAGKIGIQK